MKSYFPEAILIITLISFISLVFIFIPVTNIDKQTELTCKNLDLKETAYCLRDYIKTFYNYTIRSDKERTIEDIKVNGGDCYDYNKLYERLGSELGFDTYSYRIALGDSFHRIALISDETGYCLLDQLHKINCFKRKK